MFHGPHGRLIQPIDKSARDEADIHGFAITPFAFPLLVGPAEMSIMITLSNDNAGWDSKLLLTAASLFATC